METQIELTHRQLWFKNRINECIEEMKKLEDIQCWDTYKSCALMLSDELRYAATEWEKYYP